MAHEADEPELIEAEDGTLHAFPPDTPDLEVEKYFRRYENGQDLPKFAFAPAYARARKFFGEEAYQPPHPDEMESQPHKKVEVTTRRQSVKPIRLSDFDNPGAVFDSREAAAHDITRRINPLSRDRNKEFAWMYYTDPVSGKIGYSDPYEAGEFGGQDYGLGFSVAGAAPKDRDGNAITQGSTFGMGHTHGAGSGNDFSHREPGDPDKDVYDYEFMKKGGSTGKWNYFTLGTPGGKFFQWTPENAREELTNQ